MFAWLFKHRLVKQLKSASEQLTKDSVRALKDGKLTKKELALLRKETSAIHALTGRIWPKGLPWKTKLIRIGGLLLIFSGLGGASYLMIAQPLGAQTTGGETKTSIDITRSFVPITRVDGQGFNSLQRIDYRTPLIIRTEAGWDGWELIGAFDNHGNLSILTIEPYQDTRAIQLRTYDMDLIQVGSTRTLDLGPTLADGAIISIDDTYILAQVSDGERNIRLRRFDSDWVPVGGPVTVSLSIENETAQRISLSIDESELVMMTMAIPPKTSSARELAAPILRTFQLETLAQTSEQQLDGHADLTFDPGATFFREESGGISILMSGRPALSPGGGTVKGNELYALSYNADLKLTQAYQLINNGRPHDYAPAGVATKGNIRLAAFLKIQSLPQKQNAPLGHPPESGIPMLAAFGTNWLPEGAIIVDDIHPEYKPDRQKRGVARIIAVPFGGRVFLASLERTKYPNQEPSTTTSITIGWVEFPAF
jgi:hypothetical protein